MPVLIGVMLGAAAWWGARMAETLRELRREGKR